MNRLNTILTLATTLSFGLSVAVAQDAPAGDAPKGPPPTGAKGGQDGQKGQQGDRPRDKAKRGDRQGPGGPGGDMMGRMGGAMQELEMARAALAQVQPPLSDAQQAEVDAARESFKAEMDTWRAANDEKMRDLMQQVREAREAGGMDPELMEQMKALKESAPNAQAAFDKVRNVLSPEQQKSFDDGLAKGREAAKGKRGGDRPGADGQGPGKGKGQGKDGKGPGGADRPQRPGKDGSKPSGKDGAPPPPPPPSGDKPVFND